MDKCWFVLRQTHYAAPQYEYPSMAFGKAEGPLRLGHLLPGPRAVDNIINTGGIVPFTKDMRITKSDTAKFRYSRRTEQSTEATAASGAPIAGAAGATLNIEAAALFRKMMGDTWNIDRLETQIVQPTLDYIGLCRASPELASWITKHKTLGAWKVYIITGLMIARGGATSERSEAKEKGGSAGAAADVPGVANVKVGSKHSRKQETEVSGEHPDDFVWAFRLSCISNGIFDGEPKIEPYTVGSTLAPSEQHVDVNVILAGEGLLGDDVRTFEVLMLGSEKEEEEEEEEEEDDDDEPPEQQFFITIDGL